MNPRYKSIIPGVEEREKERKRKCWVQKVQATWTDLIINKIEWKVWLGSTKISCYNPVKNFLYKNKYIYINIYNLYEICPYISVYIFLFCKITYIYILIWKIVYQVIIGLNRNGRIEKCKVREFQTSWLDKKCFLKNDLFLQSRK